jgi:hypothetical protein
VNLFLNDADDAAAAEIEVMVAVQSARRRGVAREALELLQAWAAGALHLRRFVAKVGHANAPSAALFRKLGYTLVSSSAVFEEARCHHTTCGALVGACLICVLTRLVGRRTCAQDTLELRVEEEGVAAAFAALRCIALEPGLSQSGR